MDKPALKGFAVTVKNMLGTDGSDDSAFAWFSRLLALRYMRANGIISTDIFSAAIFGSLSGIFPQLFGGDADKYPVPENFAALVKLFADGLTDEVLRHNVQIIGWLYQFYLTEPKVHGNLKRGERIEPSRIPAATQIFTPDWIVRYMVENTLGRLWTECCESADCTKWAYMTAKADLSGTERRPESITFIDPCMGCGNILVYAFDVFMDIYRSVGCTDSEAVKKILQNNLYGLDIDRKACALAEFSLLMKAAEYCPDVLGSNISLNIGEFCSLADSYKGEVEEMRQSNIYGSLLYGGETAVPQAKKLWKMLARQYDVVVTNPPYMSGSSMDSRLLGFLRERFPDYSNDLFSAFLNRCGDFTRNGGYSGFLTPYVWMFIQSYESLRRYIYDTHSIESLIQFEYSSFRDATVPVCVFTMKKGGPARKGMYIRLSDFKGDMDVQHQKTLEALHSRDCGYVYEAEPRRFLMIPDAPAAYWVSENVAELYGKCRPLGSYVSPRKGCSTSDNDRFLRLWYEVDKHKMNLGCRRLTVKGTHEKYWFPYNKGGGYRKWYGFNSYLINWQDDGKAIRQAPTSVIANYKYFMKPGLTWSTLTSGSFSIRSFGEGYIFDNGGCCIFDLGSDREYFCALLNSKVFSYIFGQLNPTLNFQSGDVAKFPVVYSPCERVRELAEECIGISREDYDCFETSRDFKRHPLV
ncbi:MAG: N-6 DNA methylase [Ruminococcus sp.]|nr:N-6 DNA methylase [Ruminococcus sp.]